MIFTCKGCKYPCVISVDKKTTGLEPMYCPIYGYGTSRWKLTKETLCGDKNDINV